MRVLGIGRRAYLGDIYLALAREGHEVRVHATDPAPLRAFGGIIDPVADWRAELPWVGRDGIVLFEGLGHGAEQDALRARGTRVVGGSAFGDRLEQDRAFGQAALAGLGLPTAWSHSFDQPAEAAAWLARNPQAVVLKHDHGEQATFVGEHPDGADVAFMLRHAPPGRVLLMERLHGVEVGIGALFRRARGSCSPACIDFEHKRFFPGELGEMTGEMGTLASYPRRSARLFTMRRWPGWRRSLAAAGHVGYVNLNLIVDERGPFPLELTCRFGNPGFAVLAAMQADGWGDLLTRMAGGTGEGFRATPGWAVAIVLTVPPFPATLPGALPEDDPPLFYHRPPDDLAHYHPVDVREEAGQLLVHRRSGHAMIVTGTGPTVAAAQDAARARAANVIAPDLRWRDDIGARFVAGEGETLRRLGWL